ncbi:hypothetical protein FAVG1_07589 [Fusarium avenaceum]|nr:hypothetical protein FAVG1_07589 [Fusarium avenaceum]
MGSIDHLPPFRISEARLAESLHDSCQFGAAHRYGKATTETGMARLSLDDSDKQVRDWFMTYAKSLKCKTFVDQMGNLFAVRPGKNNDLPPVMMGSHLDTQPTGGRYDGILGVISGLEVLRTLNDNNFETEGPIGVVNWTNEEGARFPKMAVSSGVWADAIPLETAWDLKEVLAANPKSMKEELDRIGYCGEHPASYLSNPFAAHFELHIEQGPILEDEGLKIGVVHGVQAFKWFNMTVKGRDSHAGTTPLYARKDPVLCATKMIVAANAIAKKFEGLATTGIFTTDPGTVNTMAHTVTFTLDVRHTKDEILAKMVQECEEEFLRISRDDSEKGCEVNWELLVDSPAVSFSEECISVVEASAADVCATLPQNSAGKRWRPMISGAGHDSCYTNRRCPTSMIFTPTRSGISHNPTEYCSPEDCALGASVLLGAVLRGPYISCELDHSAARYRSAPSHHDTRQVAGVRRYRSKSQRPCDLCRARKVLCNIPDPTRPCQLCERTGRHCTFVGIPNKKQKENGFARQASVSANPSFDRIHVEPSHLSTPQIPHQNDQYGDRSAPHPLEQDRDSVGVGLTPLMSQDIFSAGADVSWNLSLAQDGVDDGQTFDFFADGELPNLEPIEDQTPPDIYRDSGMNATSTDPPDGLTNIFERLSFDQRPNYSTSLIGYSNESDPFSLNHFPYAGTNEDQTQGQAHAPVHFLQSHTETSAKGQNIVQKCMSSVDIRDNLEKLVDRVTGVALVKLLDTLVVFQDLDGFVAEASTGLLAGIYALALPFTPWDEKLCLDSAYSKPDINDLWQVSYTCLQKELHFPRLSTIQTYLLLLNHTPFDAVCVENPFVWSLAASMLAMAQSLGLNVEPAGWKLPAWEVRLRRRLWWAVYVEYTWRSVTNGRASMISDEDWDVLPLRPEDFVIELAVDIPEHIQDRSSDYFIHFCSLTEVASQVCRKFL